jgi:hypothetical protein
MLSEFKKLFIPKKLWILRLYVALLTYLVELLLFVYLVVSIYNLISNNNLLGDLILGYAGFYVVSVCLAILFVTQVVSLFLNIHDNIEDVRNKNIDPNFSIDIAADKEKKQESSVRTLFTIISIVLAIILSLVNLNRKNNNPSISTQEETPIQLNENKQSLNLALDNIFTNWSFINQFKSTANIKSSQLNEVCDESYCVSFTQIENLLIISYSPKETVESETKVYDLNNNSVVLKGKFYVGKMDYNRNQLNISDQGYNDNGRFYRDGTLDLKTLSVNWGEKQF